MATTGTISFGGIQSGLDTQSIIDKLVGLKEKQLLDPPTREIQKISDQKKAYQPILASMKTLKTSAHFLQQSSLDAFSYKTAISSDSSTLLITGADPRTAITGNYTISDITQLAQADRVIFNGVADTDTTQLGSGDFDITYKGGTYTVSIAAGSGTLDEIVSAINSAVDGVTASVVNDGSGATPYRLVLTSDETGSDTTITHNIAAIIPTLTVHATSADPENEPADAAYKINNLDFTSKKNAITTAIQGVSFSLLATNTTSDITVTVKQDSSAIIKKLTDFFTKYSELRTLMRKELLPNPDTGTLGAIASDVTLINANYRMSNIMSTRFSSLTGYEYTNLSQIGITQDVNGQIQIDSSKLTAALDTNLEDVTKLFMGSTLEDGIAEAMDDYLETLSGPGGLLPDKSESLSTREKALEKQIREREVIIEAYKIKISTRFIALEQQLTKLKSSENAIASFSGIYSSGSNQLL